MAHTARFTNATTETWMVMTKTKNPVNSCYMFDELSPGASIEMPVDWELWASVGTTTWVHLLGGKMAIFRGFDCEDIPLYDIQDIIIPSNK